VVDEEDFLLGTFLLPKCMLNDIGMNVIFPPVYKKKKRVLKKKYYN
jgi:hypothetical protein